ncbi:MAG: hypothetical protein L0Y44_08180 [Phycisphaerales bacterium]|nr:hypothetical protein [Phycisphaerales bacterium]MCI0630613.1 hypothetical protein [Phycisphaerales bacterium]MCI0674169.1 hypothetical protein [Phycisphaerales bacterium]
MSAPWNFWYHVSSNTKSTWLHGDPRGFRTRHHREHIEGDYHNPPPPGTYESKFRRSRSLLKSPPVILTREQCLIVCRTMAEALEFHKIWFADMAIGPKHFHLLAQFPPGRSMSNGRPILDPARHFTGIAKKESARRLSTVGLRPEGHTWGKRSHPVAVENEQHFLYLKNIYIPKHVEEGAVVYSIDIAPTQTQADAS